MLTWLTQGSGTEKRYPKGSGTGPDGTGPESHDRRLGRSWLDQRSLPAGVSSGQRFSWLLPKPQPYRLSHAVSCPDRRSSGSVPAGSKLDLDQLMGIHMDSSSQWFCSWKWNFIRKKWSSPWTNLDRNWAGTPKGSGHEGVRWGSHKACRPLSGRWPPPLPLNSSFEVAQLTELEFTMIYFKEKRNFFARDERWRIPSRKGSKWSVL